MLHRPKIRHRPTSLLGTGGRSLAPISITFSEFCDLLLWLSEPIEIHLAVAVMLLNNLKEVFFLYNWPAQGQDSMLAGNNENVQGRRSLDSESEAFLLPESPEVVGLAETLPEFIREVDGVLRSTARGPEHRELTCIRSSF